MSMSHVYDEFIIIIIQSQPTRCMLSQEIRKKNNVLKPIQYTQRA